MYGIYRFREGIDRANEVLKRAIIRKEVSKMNTNLIQNTYEGLSPNVKNNIKNRRF